MSRLTAWLRLLSPPGGVVETIELKLRLVHQHEVARVDLAGHRTFGAAFQRQVDLAAFHMLVDVEEPQDRAGVGRTHAHGAAAGFGTVAQFYRGARIRDGLDLQPIDPVAGAAIVELHVREFFVVKSGNRIHVDADRNGAALAQPWWRCSYRP